MDSLDLAKAVFNKSRLAFVYFRRILGAPNHFDVDLKEKLIANFYGFTYDQWKLYDLDLEKRKEYLSEFDWYKSRYINEPFDGMLNNKVVATEVLGKYIKVPEIYAIRNGGKMYAYPKDGEYIDRPMGDEDLALLIKDKGTVIFKPIDKGKGTGVSQIDYRDGSFIINGKEGTMGDVTELAGDVDKWYISEKIYQHEYSDKLYDQTSNTIRIITFRDRESGMMEIKFAVQRIGRKTTIPVDNGSQGGIVCNIDLETGKLSHGRTLHDKVVYEVHPDSGTKLDEMYVANWDYIKEKIISVARKLPFLYFVAWDVIVDPEGEPYIIEANTSSGVNIIQLWGPERQGELGAFYKAHGIIKK